MNFLKLTSVAIAIGLSTNVSGAIINYAGYSHDTDTNIVTGNGLEWLQWDHTNGESISSIQSQLDTIEGGGWYIATNAQVAELLNAFNFGTTFDNDENTHQLTYTGYSVGDSSMEADKIFISMFGDTLAAAGLSDCYAGDCRTASNVLFGYDMDGDGKYNSASVYDDYTSSDFGDAFQGDVSLSSDWVDINWSYDAWSVALVRGGEPPVIPEPEIPAVPVPAAIWLFGSGVISLVGIARRKKV